MLKQNFSFDFFSKVTLVAEAEKIITNTIICTICCGAGHVSSDCKFRKNADGTFADPTVDASMLINRNTEENQKLDCEVRVYIFNLNDKMMICVVFLFSSINHC